MKKTCFFLFLLTNGALIGAPSRESLAVQEIRLTLDQVGFQLHGQQVEIALFQERLDKLQGAVDTLNRQLRQGSTLEGRLTKLERAHEILISDFKSFKGHLNQTSAALASCQTKLSKIDSQLNTDVKNLKQSLESMLALLQKGGDGQMYIVQPGDSLGQIALDHKTDIKTLKKLNKLASDTIYVGQKLSIP